MIDEKTNGKTDADNKKNKKIDIRDFFNGNIFTKEFVQKQYGLILLISFLFLLYINNGYQSEKQHAHIVQLKTQLQDLRYEYLTLEAELVNLSKQSTISEQLRQSGSKVKESTQPPVEIK